MLAWDFLGPDVEPEVVQARVEARRQRVFRFFRLKGPQELLQLPKNTTQLDEEKAITSVTPALLSQGSVHDDGTTVVTPLDTANPAEPTKIEKDMVTPPPPPARSFSHYGRVALPHIRTFIKGLFNPMSISIYASIPISLVPDLKALFVPVPSVNMPPAPDGQPPLAFIQDIATFIGAASVPIGLICLGSSLARLKVPMNQWRTLPVSAIMWMAVGKLIISPVLGVLICKGLLQAGVLFNDRVLLFICM
jgi:hypothetical protein